MTKDGLLQGFAHFCSFCLENSDVKQRFMYQNRPSKLHQLPFDQGLDGSPLNQSSYRFRSNMRRELIVTLQVQGFQDLRQVYQNRSECHEMVILHLHIAPLRLVMITSEWLTSWCPTGQEISKGICCLFNVPKNSEIFSLNSALKYGWMKKIKALCHVKRSLPSSEYLLFA